MNALDDAPRVAAETRRDWRAWLGEHHADTTSCWLVSWKKATGRPAVSYDDAVSEALAVGWVDSLPRALDDERTMLYFAPRKPRSGWSRPNKLRVEALEREGSMTHAGAAVVGAARADGSWTMLDDVEDLVEPADLARALDTTAGARAQWDAFPRSARRGILEWILQAKRPETRRRRISETAVLAARGERANQWRPRTARTPDSPAAPATTGAPATPPPRSTP